MNIIDTNPGWNVVQILLNYLGLPDYLRAREYELFDQRRVTIIHGIHQNIRTRHPIPGEQLFWRKIFDGRILEGQKVELKDFYLSSWFPRKPGLYWTYQAQLARKKAERYGVMREENGMTIYNLHGKTLMTELGGVGSVNFQKGRNINLLTATSNCETHSGIPLAVTNRVWSKIRDNFDRYQFIKASMKGTLIPLPTSYSSIFLRSPNVPKVAVLVDNVNLIDISSSDRSYSITPWTIFERTANENEAPFGFTYATCDLGEESLDSCINWMHNYMNENSGQVVITDFDEENNQLNAMFPLNDMVNNPTVSKELISYCQQIPAKYEDYK